MPELKLDVSGVEATAQKLIVDLQRVSKQSRFVWSNEILDEAGRISQREIMNAISETTTTRSGTLLNSVEIWSAPDERVIVITAPHAVFVNDGTKPSPGRYVPALGKRLVKGRTHRPTRPHRVSLLPPKPTSFMVTSEPQQAPVSKGKTKTHKTKGQLRTEAINRRARRTKRKIVKAKTKDDRWWVNASKERRRPEL
jgi:hypothetical protein